MTPDRVDGLRELADLVVAVSGKDLPVVVARDGVGLEYTGDNARLRAEMSGLRFTPVVEAVERLYAWYAERTSLIDYEKLLVDK